MKKEIIKNELKKYYLHVDDYYKNKDFYKQIKNNKEKYKNDFLFKIIMEHVMDILPDNSNIELLQNINYHSIIWEYLRQYDINATNLNFQYFKNIAFKNVNMTCSNKLNTYMYFNDMMYLLIIA